MVTTCWSWAWSNRTSPFKWVALGSPLAASSVYGDLTCSVHTVNNLCMFNCQCHFYLCNRGTYVRLAFVPNMLSSCLEINILWLLRRWVLIIFSQIYPYGCQRNQLNSAVWTRCIWLVEDYSRNVSVKLLSKYLQWDGNQSQFSLFP